MLTGAALALGYTCIFIQCIKVLAPNLPHENFFLLGLCFLGKLQVIYMSAILMPFSLPKFF